MEWFTWLQIGYVSVSGFQRQRDEVGALPTAVVELYRKILF